MTGPLYRLEGVTKTHGSGFRLEVRELQVPAGETLCLLGPTGAGKSTLLRLLAGLEPPAGGAIWFGGGRLDAARMTLDERRRIAMVHQHARLIRGSVAFNVEWGLKTRGVPDRRARVESMLKRVGLDSIAGQAAHTLSGGQGQLVALARALILRPDVLILDEPTSHLDPARVALVESVVQEAQRETGLTAIWATHNLFQARRVAHRVALLWNGQLIEAAPTEAFFTSPADARTAAFVEGRLIY